MELALFAILAQ